MPNDATAPNERAIAARSWLENLKSFSLLFFDSAQFLEKINAQLVLHRYFLVHRGNFVQNMQHSITMTVFLVGDEYKLVEKDWPTVSDGRLTNISDEIFMEVEKIKKDTGINPNIVRVYSGAEVLVVPAR